MKKIILSAAVLSLLVSACNNQTATEATGEQQVAATDSVGTNYAVDAASSILNWEATKIVGGHNGTISLTDGSLTVKDGNISAGGFNVNMSTIKVLDLTDPKMNGDLVGHLSAPDFFDVAKYPAGKFEITKSEVLTGDAAGNTHMISGNLTLKDSVKNISFPAKVAMNNDELTADGEVVINRLQWGIVYNSVSASPADMLKKLGDKAIKDEVKIKISLKAKKG